MKLGGGATKLGWKMVESLVWSNKQTMQEGLFSMVLWKLRDFLFVFLNKEGYPRGWFILVEKLCQLGVVPSFEVGLSLGTDNSR